MKVRQLQLNARSKIDEPILQQLNEVAPIMQRNVHDAARFLLRKAMAEFIAENGIELSPTQPAVG